MRNPRSFICGVVSNKMIGMLFVVLFAAMPLKHSFAELQNQTVQKDVVGTIGYRDDLYFTIIDNPSFGKSGDNEIGFKKTDDLQLPPMRQWQDITPGMAVRVTYEEITAPANSAEDSETPPEPVVLERRALRLTIGQKEKRSLVSAS